MSRGASVVVPKIAVPDGETAAMTCPYYDRPFRRERLRDLYAGSAHEDLSNGKTAAYEVAIEAEAEDLFVYHLKVVGALGVVSMALFLPAVVGFGL